MNYRKYQLNKRNQIAVKVLDGRSVTGRNIVILDKDLYIQMLEDGAKKFEIQYIDASTASRKRLVYRKGLGIRVQSAEDYARLAILARRVSVNLNAMKRNSIKASRQIKKG